MSARKIPALLVALLVLFASACPCVSATGNNGGWYEVLEQSSVRDNGENWFKIDGTQGEFAIPLPAQTRLAKVDLLIAYETGYLPTAIKVVAGTNEYPLTIKKINDSLFRAYGNISYGYWSQLKFRVTKGNQSSAFYQVLSCRASTVNVTDAPVQGLLYRSFSDSSPLTLPNNFSFDGVMSDSAFEYKLIPVVITDWQKYDYITLFGSMTKMALSSFRASIGTKGLPYTITYMESVPTSVEGNDYTHYEYVSGTETHYYENIDVDEYSKAEGTAVGETQKYSNIIYQGAVLFTITIDLTGIDRTVGSNLDCYFTCVTAPAYGYAFNVQNASGSVVTADTTTVSWWLRFTTFMQNLFSPDTSESDQFQGEAGEKADELENANQELDNVTRPAVEDVVTDFNDFATDADFAAVGNVFGYMVNDDLFSMILLMSLTVALLAYVLYGKR